MRIAEAYGVVHVRANRGPTVKEAGVFHCQNPKCKRPLGRKKRRTKDRQNGPDLELVIAGSVSTVSARHAVALFVCQFSLHRVSVVGFHI